MTTPKSATPSLAWASIKHVSQGAAQSGILIKALSPAGNALL